MDSHKGNKGVFKRDEGFRLTFKKPLPATVVVIEENSTRTIGLPIESSIFDMSLRGAKVNTVSELPPSAIKLKLEFEISGVKMKINGEVMWSKKSYQGNIHGLKLDDTTYSDRELFNLLKKYVREDSQL